MAALLLPLPELASLAFVLVPLILRKSEPHDWIAVRAMVPFAFPLIWASFDSMLRVSVRFH